MPDLSADIAIVGSGAAGLFAGIWAGRTAQAANRGLAVTALDGARKLGAKILVAGGGRCNVTHWQVSERDFCGSTPAAIRKVLHAFGVEDTIQFFREMGVELKREETGKLFPVTDDAHTVLDAILSAARKSEVQLLHPARVEAIRREASGFLVTGSWGSVRAARVVLCAGGSALPKSGSDGSGMTLAQSLGHTVAQPMVPALVPLVLQAGHWLLGLSGVAAPATLTVRSGTGKVIASATGSALCTHFGLSGPAVLDVSRHWLVARHADPSATVEIGWWPGGGAEHFERQFLDATRQSALALLRQHLPERLARALCSHAGVEPSRTTQQVSREHRRALAQLTAACILPVTGHRGFTHAEATAGGVPLAELNLSTMESRICPGLHMAGEVCDVDGRIGGFNFQWAWASGAVAGRAAARAAW